MTRRVAVAAMAGAGIGLSDSMPMPLFACDCHTHVFGDPARFPYWEGRAYTPEPAGPEEMLALHKKLGIQRVVIVTPSVYGTDNSATLFGMKAYGKGARGVAVVPEKLAALEVDALHAAGIRGIRLNLATAGITDIEAARKKLTNAMEQLRGRSWHIQIFTTPNVIAGIQDIVMKAPMPIVFDHFAGADAAKGVGQEGFREVLQLVKSGKAYVKISGAYRASRNAPEYADARPFAKMLVEANPSRILWGTDWPHPDSAPPKGWKPTDVSPLLKVDDAGLLRQLENWVPDYEIRRRILVVNPARLYEF